MGTTSSKNELYADECIQLLKETNLYDTLLQEHSQILKDEVSYSHEVMMKPENVLKNRYADTFCMDQSRVILPAKDGESDFINANHVDGHNILGKFICCQAPLKKTAEDFWNMVFVYQVRVIVMLAKTVERGREVCYPYWSPIKGQKVAHGKFTIKTLKIKTSQYHVVTSLRVKDDTGASLDVKHFAYIDWPQDSLPRNLLNFLDFVLLVKKAQSIVEFGTEAGRYPPMVVHCSAGLNRTGAFCAIDIGLSQYDERTAINLALIVRDLRKQRSGSLTPGKHYVFCYLIMLMYVKIVDDRK